MAKIKILPKELAEKIAAGEVIERPASVIKELVENAIDAGATDVRVEIGDGGRALIRVVDDGSGILAAELPTALERHATSKIVDLEDLWKLTTMGFRGEALPSIAAISRFTIESRTAADSGRKLYLEGGALKQDDARTPLILLRGTAVSVESLFYNVPARLKFLKSKSGESAQIRELLERIAFSHPAIHFSFHSDGRKSLDLPSCKDEKQRAAQIFDTAVEDIEEFSSNFENIQAHGYLDRNARAQNSKYIYLSVNGRMVRDKLLQQAVLVGMRPRMMEGEYPMIYLRVDVPPAQVDVNVHPAKSEVRFEHARDVFQVVHGVLEKQGRAPEKPYYSFSGAPGAAQIKSSGIEYKAMPLPVPQPLFAADSSAHHTIFRSKSSITPSAHASPNVPDTAHLSPNTEVFSRLQYIGQVKNTYLLFQDESGMVVVDQHAAHERVQYEKVKAGLLAGTLKSQPMLIAATLKCTAEDAALAMDYQDFFAELGFEIESFGTNCVIIRSHPQVLAQNYALELVCTLLEELKSSEGSSADAMLKDPSRVSPKLERLIATTACHSAVRAGQALSEREARELMNTLDRTDFALNCPHGRPASIKLSFSDIENFFKR